MKRTTTLMAGLLVSTALAGAASADTIRFWTMEVQPERMAVQEEMAAGFEAATGHTVEIIPVEESDIQTRATAAFAAGDLPDVLNHTVQHLLPYAEAGLLDTAAATEVVEDLGVDSFAAGPVRMAMSDGEIVSVPTDGVTISDDPTTKELAQNTGFSTVISGPGNADGAAYADVRYLGITADANTAVAQEFVKYVVSEGYGQWLSQAPEGKFPVRRGTAAGDTSFEAAWAGLDVGVDRKAPLADIYPQQVIDDIVAGLSVGDRWGVADGQLATASKIVNAQIMSQVIREMTDGDLSVQEAADKIVAEHKALDL